jgi:hypothetical protein
MDTIELFINEILKIENSSKTIRSLLGSYVIFSLITKRYKYLKDVLIQIHSEKIYLDQ